MSVKRKVNNPIFLEETEEFCGEEMNPFVALKVEEEKSTPVPVVSKDANSSPSVPAEKPRRRRRSIAFRSWINSLFNAVL